MSTSEVGGVSGVGGADGMSGVDQSQNIPASTLRNPSLDLSMSNLKEKDPTLYNSVQKLIMDGIANEEVRKEGKNIKKFEKKMKEIRRKGEAG